MNVQAWATIFRDVAPHEIPRAAMALAEAQIRAAMVDVECLIADLSHLHERMERRRRRGAARLADVERWSELHAVAARWAARAASDRHEAERIEARADRLAGARVASWGDPVWRRAMGFPDVAEAGAFGDEDEERKAG